MLLLIVGFIFFYILTIHPYSNSSPLASSQSAPRMAVATLLNIDPTDFQNDAYIQNALVLLGQLKRYYQGPKVDYLLLYCGKGPLLSEPLEFPKKLQQILKGMGIIPILVPEGEGTPIYWFYKMNVSGHDSYKRSISKIHLWTLEDQYDKILYIDSDTIATSDAITPLFNLSQGYDFSAVIDPYIDVSYDPDIVPYGDQNYFNAGLFVLRPSKKVYENMVKFFGNGSLAKQNQQEWDHGFTDQDFLNFYFGAGWKVLPKIYNVLEFQYRGPNIFDASVVLHGKIWNDEVLEVLPIHILNSYKADLLSVQNLLKS